MNRDRILDRKRIKALARIETTECQPVRFSPDGKRLATGHRDGTVHLWDAATGRAVGEVKGHTDSVYGLAFVRDGWFVTGGSDGTVRLWKVPTP